MSFTDFQVHEWLEGLQGGMYAALHFDSPVHAGAYASEFSGEGYVRAKITFTVPSNRTMWNINVVSFAGLPANRILYIGGWDALNGGNLRWETQLPGEGVRVIQGGGYSVQPNDIALSFA